MALKLLIFGLPGSGKSTIARCIKDYLKDRNWRGFHFSDHIILEEMFQADTEHEQFKPAKHGGFDVIDFTVFDIALRELEQKLSQYLFSSKQEELVLIEFARNDYRRAFQQLSETFLHDAYFLYLDVETDICKRRIQERISKRSSENDFYVSDYIFSTYYNEDNGRSIPQILEDDYGIDKERVKVIDNNGLVSDSIDLIYQFVDTICGLEILRES